MTLDPVVLFFILGLLAALAKSDLKLPPALYETLSVFLLIAIGLKGGVALSKLAGAAVLGQVASVIVLGAVLTLLAFGLLRLKLGRADAAATAAHYGSVSVVTFAVATAYLARQGVEAEPQLTVFLAVMEMPALVVGVLLARLGGERRVNWARLGHEVFLGKSMVLLIGGLLIGWLAGSEGIQPLDRLFFDLFKGMLAIFLLEMGLVAASRLDDLRRSGRFLIGFAILMPLAAGLLGIATATLIGLSVGGTVLLATLFASASYIAAPAAMRIALPEANPALSIGSALGVTFPFNLLAGIPTYHWLATQTGRLIH